MAHVEFLLRMLFRQNVCIYVSHLKLTISFTWSIWQKRLVPIIWFNIHGLRGYKKVLQLFNLTFILSFSAYEFEIAVFS